MHQLNYAFWTKHMINRVSYSSDMDVWALLWIPSKDEHFYIMLLILEIETAVTTWAEHHKNISFMFLLKESACTSARVFSLDVLWELPPTLFHSAWSSNLHTKDYELSLQIPLVSTSSAIDLLKVLQVRLILISHRKQIHTGVPTDVESYPYLHKVERLPQMNNFFYCLIKDSRSIMVVSIFNGQKNTELSLFHIWFTLNCDQLF